MGFWNKTFEITKNTITVIINGLDEQATKIKEKQEEIENMSDEKLNSFIQRGNKHKHLAIKELKKREMANMSNKELLDIVEQEKSYKNLAKRELRKRNYPISNR